VLGIALKVRWLVDLLRFAALAGSLMMLRYNVIGSEYAPAEDNGLFTTTLTMPPGTSLQGTEAATRLLEQFLAQIPEVEGLFTTVGSGGGFGGGGSGLTIRLMGEDLAKLTELANQVEAAVRAISGAVDVQNGARVAAYTRRTPNRPLIYPVAGMMIANASV
jgi:hydrophobic/amphiphilic exporter-1 (mainly G- bacteria), HAE1 family